MTIIIISSRVVTKLTFLFPCTMWNYPPTNLIEDVPTDVLSFFKHFLLPLTCLLTLESKYQTSVSHESSTSMETIIVSNKSSLSSLGVSCFSRPSYLSSTKILAKWLFLSFNLLFILSFPSSPWFFLQSQAQCLGFPQLWQLPSLLGVFMQQTFPWVVPLQTTLPKS